MPLLICLLVSWGFAIALFILPLNILTVPLGWIGLIISLCIILAYVVLGIVNLPFTLILLFPYLLILEFLCYLALLCFSQTLPWAFVLISLIVAVILGIITYIVFKCLEGLSLCLFPLLIIIGCCSALFWLPLKCCIILFFIFC